VAQLEAIFASEQARCDAIAASSSNSSGSASASASASASDSSSASASGSGSVAFNVACAAGEMGLDYDRNFSPPDVQRTVFRAQCELACRCVLFLNRGQSVGVFLCALGCVCL
jgi:Tat protein secretion system quality control protein TatD with DNase activity